MLQSACRGSTSFHLGSHPDNSAVQGSRLRRLDCSIRCHAWRSCSLRQEFAGAQLRSRCSNGSRVQASRWLENSAETAVNIPIESAWDMWEDRERIPNWMPWIKSVKVQPDNPALSKWLLETEQFGRSWEFSWLAQNLAPIKYQKIHWRSVPGSSTMGSGLDIANTGQIRFRKTSPDSCIIKLTISYEVPDLLGPFAEGLTPVVEGILQRDMKRFAEMAPQHV